MLWGLSLGLGCITLRSNLRHCGRRAPSQLDPLSQIPWTNLCLNASILRAPFPCSSFTKSSFILPHRGHLSLSGSPEHSVYLSSSTFIFKPHKYLEIYFSEVAYLFGVPDIPSVYFSLYGNDLRTCLFHWVSNVLRTETLSYLLFYLLCPGCSKCSAHVC